MLHSLGFRWRRPKLVALKSDPMKDFKLEVIDIFLTAFGSACTVFFQDESYCQLLPNVRSCWMRRGQQKEIITPGTNKRVSVYGALDPRTGKWIHSIFLKKNAQNFIAFLEILCSRVKTGPIIVILDNDRTHKAKVVKEWLMTHPEVHLLWLPKHTPHLNPVETVWRHLKGHLANHCFMDVDELIWTIEQYFSHGSGVNFKLPIAA
ncbi:MAG: IS630 family transposase [Firmicutes bacterium]|nr:IS630 family transposase [Bacillota bacterium]